MIYNVVLILGVQQSDSVVHVWFSRLSHVRLCDPIDCSPPGSSAHGISQARILEWVAFPSPGDLPNPGIGPASSALAGGFFTTEPPGNPSSHAVQLKATVIAETNRASLVAQW